MTVEDIIRKIENLDAQTIQIQKEKAALTAQLKSVNKAEWDWVSVRKGAELLDVTPPVIYARINNGKLTSKYIGAKVYVKKSELLTINDKYSV